MAKTNSEELVKVKILASFSGVGFAYTIGEIVEIPAEEAVKIIEAKYGKKVR